MEEFSDAQRKIIEKNSLEYCVDNMKKLKDLCYPLLIKIGGISQKDYDDFYSIALDVLTFSALNYDETVDCQFKTYLTSNIKRKFNTEIRDRNRGKRIPAKKIESLDAKRDDNDQCTLNNVISDNSNVCENIINRTINSPRIEEYMNKLSKTQRQIVLLLSDGYKSKEIRELLHITEKIYNQNLAAIQSYENVKVLIERK